MGFVIPQCCWEMTQEEAQAYLNENPIIRKWESLNIGSSDDVSDNELSCLKYLPELQMVTIRNDNISDDGVRSICALECLADLTLYSAKITDNALKYVERVGTLRVLDCQGSFGISKRAFAEAVARMSWVKTVYPPNP